MASNQDLLVELLQEVREKQDAHSEILHHHSMVLKEVQRDLFEHKEGVIQNRESLSCHTSRLEKLEEPGKVGLVVKKYLIAIGTVVASLMAIERFSDWLKEFIK
jgi:hypothetical protein